MQNTTNIESLGTEYTVATSDGKIIDTVRVIPYREILDVIGEFGDNSISSYIGDGIEILEGNDDIDPNSILWYATTDSEVVLADIIEYCVMNDYTIVILEHLEDTE